MDNNSGQDIPDDHPAIQVIEQINAAADVSEAGTLYWNQSHFQVELKVGILPSAPVRELFYFEWHITTNPMEIDGGREDCSEDHIENAEEICNPESMDNENEGGHNHIDNIEESGRNMDKEDTHPSMLPPSLLKGYEYTTFNPTLINQNSPGITVYMPHPTQADVLATIKDLNEILHSKCDTGQGYKDPEIDLWCHARVEGMLSMFHTYVYDPGILYLQ